jgi:hypothetical protein
VESNDCNFFADSTLSATPPTDFPKIFYLRGAASFREEFSSEYFIFKTCGQGTRLTIVVDDSDVPTDHSLVYFDSHT